MNINKTRMKMLISVLNKATKAYDEGKPEMPDHEWDKLYFQLQDLEEKTGIVFPNSPTVHITYEVKSALQKVEHNHKMLSLAKTKDWKSFEDYFKVNGETVPVCTMAKMDGLTCSLRYVNGDLVSAETRGNGIIGEDILYNILTFPSVPYKISYKEELVVDGEVICTYDDFKDFADDYKNPRNFAAGSIRLLDANECKKRKLTFVAWKVVKGFDNVSIFHNRLMKLMDLGFFIVPWATGVNEESKEFIISQASSFGYPIDGLVARFDEVAYGDTLGETDHHAKDAFAFKFFDESYETKLIDIEWSMGRTGVLTPIAIFEPLDIDGSIVSRASLHNLSVLKDTLGGYGYEGQRVNVAKMNMIIPQIVGADKTMPEDTMIKFFGPPCTCPACGGPTTIEVTAFSGIENVTCDNPGCEGKLINRIDHFAGKKGLDMKGLSKATFNKLIEWGWITNIEDIFNLKEHREDWIKKDGFGVKSVDKMLESIQVSRNCDLENFIAALGIPLIGKRYAKIIADKEQTWEHFISDIENKERFYLWEGFGPEMHDALIDFDYSMAKHLVDTGIIIFNEKEPVEEKPQTLSGIKVVITGKLSTFKNRNELKELIESCGGQVVGSVSKNTNILINNDAESTSSKNVSAKKLGIPILSENDFKEKYFDFL